MSCRVSLPKGCHLNDHWSSSPTALAFPIPKRWPKLVCEWWNHHPPIRRLGMHPTMFFGFVGGIPTPLKNMKVRWDDYSQYMPKEKFQTTIFLKKTQCQSDGYSLIPYKKLAMFNGLYMYIYMCVYFVYIHSIWVKYNISLTWIVRPFGGDSPY